MYSDDVMQSYWMQYIEGLTDKHVVTTNKKLNNNFELNYQVIHCFYS